MTGDSSLFLHLLILVRRSPGLDKQQLLRMLQANGAAGLSTGDVNRVL